MAREPPAEEDGPPGKVGGSRTISATLPAVFLGSAPNASLRFCPPPPPQLLGYMQFRFSYQGEFLNEMSGKPSLFIWDLQVAPEAQRKGLGRHFLILAELIARTTKMHFVQVLCPDVSVWRAGRDTWRNVALGQGWGHLAYVGEPTAPPPSANDPFRRPTRASSS